MNASIFALCLLHSSGGHQAVTPNFGLGRASRGDYERKMWLREEPDGRRLVAPLSEVRAGGDTFKEGVSIG